MTPLPAHVHESFLADQIRAYERRGILAAVLPPDPAPEPAPTTMFDVFVDPAPAPAGKPATKGARP